MPLAVWKAAFQVSPIVLTGGIAQNTPSSMMSFLALVNPQVYGKLIDSQSPGWDASNPANYDMDQAFGAFNVLPGGSLCNQTIPKYPLADQTMAANAIVRDPNSISLIWDAPMRGQNAWGAKLATTQALKLTLDTHNNLGGMYIILTPGFFYDNCIMTALTDNSRATNSLPQNAWRFDFERPMVVTDQEALYSQNLLMSKLTGGLPTAGGLTGPALGGLTGLAALIPGFNTFTTATVKGRLAGATSADTSVYNATILSTNPANPAYSP